MGARWRVYRRVERPDKRKYAMQASTRSSPPRPVCCRLDDVRVFMARRVVDGRSDVDAPWAARQPCATRRSHRRPCASSSGPSHASWLRSLRTSSQSEHAPHRGRLLRYTRGASQPARYPYGAPRHVHRARCRLSCGQSRAFGAHGGGGQSGRRVRQRRRDVGRALRGGRVQHRGALRRVRLLRQEALQAGRPSRPFSPRRPLRQCTPVSTCPSTIATVEWFRFPEPASWNVPGDTLARMRSRRVGLSCAARRGQYTRPPGNSLSHTVRLSCRIDH